MGGLSSGRSMLACMDVFIVHAENSSEPNT